MVYYEREAAELYHDAISTQRTSFCASHRSKLVHEYDRCCDCSHGPFRGDDRHSALWVMKAGRSVGNTIVPFSFYAPDKLREPPARGALRRVDALIAGPRCPMQSRFSTSSTNRRQSSFRRFARDFRECQIESRPYHAFRCSLRATNVRARRRPSGLSFLVFGLRQDTLNIQDAEAEDAGVVAHWVCKVGVQWLPIGVIDARRPTRE